MSSENPERQEFEYEIALDTVPDWHYEPGTGLWEFGRPLDQINLSHRSETVPVPDEVLNLRKNVELHERPDFFSGPFANVEHVRLTEHGVALETAETDFFTYLASAYYYRDQVGENPIRPLGVQATIFSPDGKKIVLERRPESLADFPNKLSVFGGALKPQEVPDNAILSILNRKLQLDLQPDQVHASGLVRENINNIYCVTYTITLTKSQYAQGHDRAVSANRSGKRKLYQVQAREAEASIEHMFLGKRPISEWDPNAYFNILYALGSTGNRSREQLEALTTSTKQRLKDHPLTYTYPLEQYLTHE